MARLLSVILCCVLQVARRLKGAISSKINGYEDLLSGLVAESCIDVLPKVRTSVG